MTRNLLPATSQICAVVAAAILLALAPMPVQATSETPPPAARTTGSEPPPADAAAAATTAEPSPAQPEASPAASAAEPEKPKPPAPTLIARIHLTSQTMTVQENGKTVHTWKVSTGAPGYATPAGSFRPGWMARSWYSRQYDSAPMPYSVFFNGGIAVHGTMSPGSLGRAASHGCVRLSVSNAAQFYRLVGKHSLAQTRIIVYGAQPFGRYIASRSRTQDLRSASDWVYSPSAQAGRRTIVRYDGYGYAPAQQQRRIRSARAQAPYWQRY